MRNRIRVETSRGESGEWMAFTRLDGRGSLGYGATEDEAAVNCMDAVRYRMGGYRPTSWDIRRCIEQR